MKILLLNICSILLLFFSLNGDAQVQALFNDKVEAKSMSARWELDSTSTRGTFLLTPYKSIYILPFLWSSNPNRKPFSGNDASEYVTSSKIPYNAVEAMFQLCFKTKILYGFTPIYGWLTHRFPIGKFTIKICLALLENLIMSQSLF